MASTEIDFQPAKPKKQGLAGKWEGFRTFCYNPQNGTFCGRTGKSWGKIGLFYFVYYSLLAGFCAAMMAIFFTTIDDKQPKQQGMDSLIKGNPGMAFIPMPDIERTLVKFKTGDTESIKKYVKELTDFLKPYKDPKLQDQTIDCTGKTREEIADSGKPCRYNLDSLGTWCNEANNFGFFEGQPCIAMKMNKVYGWVPDPYTTAEAPAGLPSYIDFDNSLPVTCEGEVFGWLPDEYNNSTKPAPALVADRLVPGHLPITCQGEQNSDIDTIGEIEFYPPGGFPVDFFPYKNIEGYRSPVVMARFKNPLPGSIILVWCKVWANNIYHHKNDRAGSFRFELLVN